MEDIGGSGAYPINSLRLGCPLSEGDPPEEHGLISEKSKAELIDQVVERVRARLDGEVPERAERFVRQVYAHVPPADILGDTPDNLAGAALSIWEHAQERVPGQPKVRVYTPRIETNGWESSHSVVEIVNDDMPFLVDSVSAELRRLDADGPAPDPSDRARRAGCPRPAPGPGRRAGRVGHARAGERPARGPARSPRGPGSKRCWRTCAPRWRTGARCAQALLGSRGRAGKDAAAAAPARDRGGHRLPRMAGRQPLHLPRLSRVQLRAAKGRRRWRAISPRPGWACCATTSVPVFEGLRNLGHPAAGRPRTSCASRELLLVTKANRRSTVHRAVPMDAIGVKRFDAEGQRRRRAPVRRPVHLVRLQPAARATSRCCASKVEQRRCAAPASPRTATTARRWPHILETYPARRAVPDLRGRAVRDRDRHPAAAGAPADRAVRAPRSVRALRLLPRLRAARPLRHRAAARVSRPSSPRPTAAR